MPVARDRIDALYGRTADLVCTDGTALVVRLGPIEDSQGGAQLHIHVLAVERRGTHWRFEPGQSRTLPIGEVQGVRPVVFLSGPGV